MKFIKPLTLLMCLCMLCTMVACTEQLTPSDGNGTQTSIPSDTPDDMPNTDTTLYTYYVIAAKIDIPKGTYITTENRNDYFIISSIQIPEQRDDYFVNSYDTQTAIAQLVGQWAVEDIAQDDAISLTHFTKIDPFGPQNGDEYLSVLLTQKEPGAAGNANQVKGINKSTDGSYLINDERFIFTDGKFYPAAVEKILFDGWVYTEDMQYWLVSNIASPETTWRIQPLEDRVLYAAKAGNDLRVWVRRNNELHVCTYASTGVMTSDVKVIVNDCYDTFDCLLLSGINMHMWTPEGTIFVATITELIGAATLDAVSPDYFNKEYLMDTLPEGYTVALQYTSLHDKYMSYRLPTTGAAVEYKLQLPEGYTVLDINFIQWKCENNKVSCVIIFANGSVWGVHNAQSSADVELTLSQKVAQTSILSQNSYTIAGDMVIVTLKDNYCYVLNLAA